LSDKKKTEGEPESTGDTPLGNAPQQAPNTTTPPPASPSGTQPTPPQL